MFYNPLFLILYNDISEYHQTNSALNNLLDQRFQYRICLRVELNEKQYVHPRFHQYMWHRETNNKIWFCLLSILGFFSKFQKHFRRWYIWYLRDCSYQIRREKNNCKRIYYFSQNQILKGDCEIFDFWLHPLLPSHLENTELCIAEWKPVNYHIYLF